VGEVSEVSELERKYLELVKDLDSRRQEFLMVSAPMAMGTESEDVMRVVVDRNVAVTADNFEQLVTALRISLQHGDIGARFK
jgi:hypothetical protein